MATKETKKNTKSKNVKVELEKFDIVSMPNKLEYYENESISLDGLHIDAIYSDGSSKDVTDKFSLFDNTANLGEKSFSLFGMGVEIKIPITVLLVPVTRQEYCYSLIIDLLNEIKGK